MFYVLKIIAGIISIPVGCIAYIAAVVIAVAKMAYRDGLKEVSQS